MSDKHSTDRGRHRRTDDLRWPRMAYRAACVFVAAIAVVAVVLPEPPAPKAVAKPRAPATAKPQTPALARPMAGLSPVTATGTVTTPRRDTAPAQAAAPRIHVRHTPTPRMALRRPARSISPRRPARHPAPDTPDTPTPPPSPTAEAIPPTPLPGGSMRRPV